MQPNQTINPLIISSIYTVLLTQTSTNDPVPTVLQNTTGQTITWTRDGAGFYIATSDEPLFTANKTTIQTGLPQTARTVMAGVLTDTQNITLITYQQNLGTHDLTATDDILLKTMITIKIYK